ncbi:DMT family transporter [Actibacterium sp. 188UL27-1]|uniref:DMT family transporter n=1 Tax=Actibacterium sp. 188UL27-1 TaxID=2786961 RepID=UPI001958E848|nr:DMT family transporter [Actibacterium sp. 188UL27-1]MBM7069671.1 DMT family transporter [Actibacterium sp. 188UL27-1]
MDTVRAAALMTLAMAGFAAGDALIKEASATLTNWQILLLLGGGGSAIFACLAILRGVPLINAVFWNRAILVRNGFEMLAALSMITALSRVPLTTLTVILQATPLLVTAGAVLVFGMQVGWRRWSAISFGFVGVLLILRPGLEGFDPNALFALAAAIALAARDLATRAVPGSVHSLLLAFYGFAVIAPLGMIGIAVDPGGTAWQTTGVTLMILAVILTACAYYAITAAMRIGDIAAVAPFRYARLLFGLLIGIIAFNERPDLLTYAGAALILGSGLYTLARDRRTRHTPQN